MAPQKISNKVLNDYMSGAGLYLPTYFATIITPQE